MYKPYRLNCITPGRNIRAVVHPSIEYEDTPRLPLTDRTNSRDAVHHDFKSHETTLLQQMVLHSRAKSGVRDILRKTLKKRNPSCYGENRDSLSLLKLTSNLRTQTLDKGKISSWLKHNNTFRVRARSITRDSIKI